MHRVGVESGEHTWAEVIFSAPSIFLFYLKKLSCPGNLSGCYVNPLTARKHRILAPVDSRP